MDYITTHLAQSFIVLGLILLAIEVLVLGFSTFVLFFVGIGTIVTGILMMFGLVPETVLTALLMTAIIASLIAIFSWKPMKRTQNKVDYRQVNNDMIGHQFILSDTLERGKTITHHYSGIDWKVQAAESLPSGIEVKITKMEVGLLTVTRVN